MGSPSILVWNYVSGQRVRCDWPGVPNLSLSPHSPKNDLVYRLSAVLTAPVGALARP
jgi:hypothetical protein